MSEQPKVLGDMTDAEVGALLKARLMRKKMQVFVDGDWRPFPNMNRAEFQLDHAYRVKPEPVKKAVTRYGSSIDNWWLTGSPCSRDTHLITFDLIDGKPDCASIRMERIK